MYKKASGQTSAGSRRRVSQSSLLTSRSITGRAEVCLSAAMAANATMHGSFRAAVEAVPLSFKRETTVSSTIGFRKPPMRSSRRNLARPCTCGLVGCSRGEWPRKSRRKDLRHCQPAEPGLAADFGLGRKGAGRGAQPSSGKEGQSGLRPAPLLAIILRPAWMFWPKERGRLLQPDSGTVSRTCRMRDTQFEIRAGRIRR